MTRIRHAPLIGSLTLIWMLFLQTSLDAQQVQITGDGRVGLGTLPDSSAILQINSNTRGVLFPMLTSAQRDAIPDPADALHIFNSDIRCLQFYDAAIALWDCYCQECRLIRYVIAQDACAIDFFLDYTNGDPDPHDYLVFIPDTVVISACAPGQDAIDFSGLPPGSTVRIYNDGLIVGGGGNGGDGGNFTNCMGSLAAEEGMDGGHAIVTSAGFLVTLTNSGLVAGGGGGGAGGGSPNPTNDCAYVGGGGGGGAGNPAGQSGIGSDEQIQYDIFCFNCTNENANNGIPGSLVDEINDPITGGSGNNGFEVTNCAGTTLIGIYGGDGGDLGSDGSEGENCAQPIGQSGGLAGKVISGGSGNVINNIANGVSYGVVD